MRVLFEGIDGCGKDTQIALLKKKMEITSFKYPTKQFSPIWDYLRNKEAVHPRGLFLLFLADIANEQKKMEETHSLSVIDRYVMSTIAYEVDEFSYGQAKDIVSDIGFIRPDIVFLLDLPAEVACSRKQEQKKNEGVPPDRYDLDVDYLSKVRNRFLMLKEDSFMCSRWVTLDATRPAEEIHTEILMMLKGQK